MLNMALFSYYSASMTSQYPTKLSTQSSIDSSVLSSFFMIDRPFLLAKVLHMSQLSEEGLTSSWLYSSFFVISSRSSISLITTKVFRSMLQTLTRHRSSKSWYPSIQLFFKASSSSSSSTRSCASKYSLNIFSACSSSALSEWRAHLPARSMHQSYFSFESNSARIFTSLQPAKAIVRLFRQSSSTFLLLMSYGSSAFQNISAASSFMMFVTSTSQASIGSSFDIFSAISSLYNWSLSENLSKKEARVLAQPPPRLVRIYRPIITRAGSSEFKQTVSTQSNKLAEMNSFT